jgi:hypothetical protein
MANANETHSSYNFIRIIIQIPVESVIIYNKCVDEMPNVTLFCMASISISLSLIKFRVT